MHEKELSISPIGIGSYKGSLNADDDLLMFNGMLDSIIGGMNMIDTCSNFRGGRSEKVISLVLKYLIEKI